eukprot:7689841-Pyramimonas_sp.AAC.1
MDCVTGVSASHTRAQSLVYQLGTGVRRAGQGRVHRSAGEQAGAIAHAREHTGCPRTRNEGKAL